MLMNITRRMTWVFALILFNVAIAKGSTTGKEFVIGFMSFNSGEILKLDIASSTSGYVYLYAPYLGINTTSSFNKTFSIALDNSIELFGTKIGRNGILIKSNVDVSVYVTTIRSSGYHADTYTSIPLDSLGNKYEIASYIPNQAPNYPSTFMVIAAFDDTSINIAFPNGTTISKTINWLDIYQEASPDSDLTGTFVQSSKPVSVVSGIPCAVVNTGLCGFLVEQLLPLNAFQSQFIVPPIYSSKQYIVRVFSSQSNNTVCLKNASFENCTMIGSTKWIESAPTSSPLVVTSKIPISVLQYKEGQSYMSIIPGIRQFTNSYAFVVPTVYNQPKTYVAVTIRSSAIHTLRLDGRSPSDQIVDKANVPAPFNEYTVLTCNITTGYHVMTSTETNVMFGLISFGYSDNGNHGEALDNFVPAFGFPVGMLMPSDKQQICYNCDDMSDLELCDTVQRCATGERCMVQHGHSQYSSRCANVSECSNAQTSHGHCLECCDGDYCNGRGCGDNGLVPRSHRGPMCYDCNHVLKPDQCKTVRPCYEDEVCSIEEFDWLGHSHFKLGCVAASCSAIEHRRSVPRCKACCSEDFCNTNCTMSHGHGASIIG